MTGATDCMKWSLRRLFLVGFLSCMSVSFAFLMLPYLLSQEATEYLGYVHTCGASQDTDTEFVMYVRVQKTGSTFWSPIFDLALQEFPSAAAEHEFHKEWLCTSALTHAVEDNVDSAWHYYSPNRLVEGCRYIAQGSNVAVHNVRSFLTRHVHCGEEWRIVVDNGHISLADLQAAAQAVVPLQIYQPKRVSYVTLLREPRSRTCSEYRHSVLKPLQAGDPENNWLGITCCPEGLDHCAFEGWVDTCLEANNRQSRMIAGGDVLPQLVTTAGNLLVDRAIRALDSEYRMFAILEKFEDSLLFLKYAFGLDAFTEIPSKYAPQVNIDPVTGEIDWGYSAADMQYAGRANVADLVVYDAAVRLFDEKVQAIKAQDPSAFRKVTTAEGKTTYVFGTV